MNLVWPAVCGTVSLVVMTLLTGCSGSSQTDDASPTRAQSDAYCRLSRLAGHQLSVLHAADPAPAQWDALTGTLRRVGEAAPSELTTHVVYVRRAVEDLRDVSTRYEVSVPQIGAVADGKLPRGMTQTEANSLLDDARRLDLFTPEYRRRVAAITEYDQRVCRLG